MRIIRQFKIENQRHDPRKKLKIFLFKEGDIYCWGYYTYDNTSHKLKSHENEFSTVKDAMKFKDAISDIWDLIYEN